MREEDEEDRIDDPIKRKTVWEIPKSSFPRMVIRKVTSKEKPKQMVHT
jgi:hypothetical protein